MPSSCVSGAIFQFTPLREGRRRTASRRRRLPPNFNSRPSARGDCNGVVLRQQMNISIHAPPRGATSRGRTSATASAYFNSRPSARGDSAGGWRLWRPLAFQFTPLREGRRHRQGIYRADYDFNSRPSARGDSPPKPRRCVRTISIHAPPRGATVVPRAAADVHIISIHAPPRGATAKDMQFLQIFCSTLTNQHGLTTVPRNLSRLF